MTLAADAPNLDDRGELRTVSDLVHLAGSPNELDPVLERLETAQIVTDIVYSILGV
jgi:hypothetical protein